MAPYDDAADVPSFLEWAAALLEPWGFQEGISLPLVSVCRDELMFSFLDAVADAWGPCFDLSSLGGLPLLGRTGIAAALGHAPDQAGRHRMVVFAFPHIGLDAAGVVGLVQRPGVPGTTAACGAVDVARRALLGGVSGVVLDPHDIEESLLVARLRRVLGDGAVPGLAEVTEIVRGCAVDELVLLLSGLSGSLATDSRVDFAVLSGVVVHGPDADRVSVSSATVVVDGEAHDLPLS